MVGWTMDSVQTSALVKWALPIVYILRGGGLPLSITGPGVDSGSPQLPTGDDA
ncbi:hypothetical protein N2K95_01250 [Arthrobacter zhaoxinii]|uniref:Uncharacterized protein n=1 Tax=Arthrobacter zhaoxinii TaxID=2964616 RepID=A0ABY5YTL4_9MICC|nr:hypothetical protein [Arthrobacter zhaoxinii]UWX97354.1 hypothetical protein N2K95_01250 [Arthrobacter zhaoxinii]